MREPVVIVQVCYDKGKTIFDKHSDRFQWIQTAEDEEIVTNKVRENKARIAVLGVAPYRAALYAALAEVAGGRQEAGSRPALIARFGVGFETIDTELCKQSNIYLTITPGTLDQSVAEHTIALLLAVTRHVSVLDRAMHAREYTAVRGIELAGKPLGIAGFGKIGKQVALIASRGLNMKIHAFDCLSLAEQARQQGKSIDDFVSFYGISEYTTDFEVFAAQVPIVSIHMSTNDQTRDFFDAQRLALMQDGAVLINTGRGALISEPDLYEALASGKLVGAGIDVFAREPYTPVSAEHDFRELPNVVLTPHVASNTTEANQNMASAVVTNIDAFLQSKYDALTTPRLTT